MTSQVKEEFKDFLIMAIFAIVGVIGTFFIGILSNRVDEMLSILFIPWLVLVVKFYSIVFNHEKS